MNPFRWVSDYLRPRSPLGPGPEALPPGPDLFTEGDFDSVEAWLKQEIAFWGLAAKRSPKPENKRAWAATSAFYEQRLAEHLERRTSEPSQ